MQDYSFRGSQSDGEWFPLILIVVFLEGCLTTIGPFSNNSSQFSLGTRGLTFGEQTEKKGKEVRRQLWPHGLLRPLRPLRLLRPLRPLRLLRLLRPLRPLRLLQLQQSRPTFEWRKALLLHLFLELVGASKSSFHFLWPLITSRFSASVSAVTFVRQQSCRFTFFMALCGPRGRGVINRLLHWRPRFDPSTITIFYLSRMRWWGKNFFMINFLLSEHSIREYNFVSYDFWPARLQ